MDVALNTIEFLYLNLILFRSIGGLFALGANTRQNEHTEKFMEIGKGITNTCHESYIRSTTRLGPEAFR